MEFDRSKKYLRSDWLIIPKLWKDFFSDDNDFDGHNVKIELFELIVCWNLRNPPEPWKLF